MNAELKITFEGKGLVRLNMDGVQSEISNMIRTSMHASVTLSSCILAAVYLYTKDKGISLLELTNVCEESINKIKNNHGHEK